MTESDVQQSKMHVVIEYMLRLCALKDSPIKSLKPSCCNHPPFLFFLTLTMVMGFFLKILSGLQYNTHANVLASFRFPPRLPFHSH